jgi:hypothetical protein
MRRVAVWTDAEYLQGKRIWVELHASFCGQNAMYMMERVALSSGVRQLHIWSIFPMSNETT